MLTTIDKQENGPVRIGESASGILERTMAREIRLSRLLVFYITGGLLFMLLPYALPRPQYEGEARGLVSDQGRSHRGL